MLRCKDAVVQWYRYGGAEILNRCRGGAEELQRSCRGATEVQRCRGEDIENVEWRC